MKIEKMPVGIIYTNCYIFSTDQKNAAVVDPGGNAERILAYLEQNGLTLSMILLTHGHHDHVAAVWELREKTGAPLYIQQEDGEMLQDAKLLFCSSEPYFSFTPITDYTILHDGDELELDELNIRVVHTPGHTKGSSVYLVGESMFSGDTLFARNIGRCDLYGGDYNVMKQSLKKLAELEGDYTVYPGHGENTTLGEERRHNVYMGLQDYDDYF